MARNESLREVQEAAQRLTTLRLNEAKDKAIKDKMTFANIVTADDLDAVYNPKTEEVEAVKEPEVEKPKAKSTKKK